MKEHQLLEERKKLEEALQGKGLGRAASVPLSQHLEWLVRGGVLDCDLGERFLESFRLVHYGDGRWPSGLFDEGIAAIDAIGDEAATKLRVELGKMRSESTRSAPQVRQSPALASAGQEPAPITEALPHNPTEPEFPTLASAATPETRSTSITLSNGHKAALAAGAVMIFIAGVLGAPFVKEQWTEFFSEAQREFSPQPPKPWFNREVTLPHSGGEGRGLAWVDYDGDGDLDLVVASGRGTILYRQEAGELARHGPALGSMRSGIFADTDRDGDLDLFGATHNGYVFWKTEKGKLTKDLSAITLQQPFNMEGAAFVDPNADGWADIALTNGEHGNLLLVNRKGNFSTDGSRLDFGEGTIGNGDFLIADYIDGDDVVDLVYNIASGFVAKGNEGGFFPMFQIAGLSSTPNEKRGLAAADLNKDGNIDLLVPHKERTQLFVGDGAGDFKEITDVGDLAAGAHSAAVGDIDLDGRLDVILGREGSPPLILRGEGDGRFTDVTAQTGLLAAHSRISDARGIALVDFDGDGDLDVTVNRDDSAATLLINDVPRPKWRGQLEVVLSAKWWPCPILTVSNTDERLRQTPACVTGMGVQQPGRALFSLVPGSWKVHVRASTGTAQHRTVEVRAGEVIRVML